MTPGPFNTAGLAALAALLVTGAAQANPGDPLQPSAHGAEAAYQSDFDKPGADLAARLPWRERFTADGAFNREVASAAANTAQPAATAAGDTAATADGFHTRGVIEDVRQSAGKLKIAHGPIDHLGMPGMTMLFGVSDASMLEGLNERDEIEFDVESTDSGFVIMRLRRVEDQ